MRFSRRQLVQAVPGALGAGLALSHLGAAWTAAAAPAAGAPWTDLRAHGARGDGRADDTAAIQRAIAQTPTSGMVFFPPGTYRITRTIEVDKPLSLIGAGPSRQSRGRTEQRNIRLVKGADVLGLWIKTQCEVRNLVVEGREAGDTTDGIRVGANNCLFINVAAWRHGGHGWVVTDDPANTHFSVWLNCAGTENRGDGMRIQATASGLRVNMNTLIACEFNQNGGHGLNQLSGLYWHHDLVECSYNKGVALNLASGRHVLTSCHTEGNGGGGVVLRGAHTIVLGGQFTDYGVRDEGGESSVLATGTWRLGSSLTFGRGSLFTSVKTSPGAPADRPPGEQATGGRRDRRREADSEVGRVVFNSAENRLYIRGTNGWVSVPLS